MHLGLTLLETALARALGPQAAVAERQAFLHQVQAILRQEGQSRLAPLVVGARRMLTQPRAGGETLVVTVSSHAAMAKLRLLEPRLLALIRAETPEIETVKVVAQRAVAASPGPVAAARPAAPAEALARLRAFYSQDH